MPSVRQRYLAESSVVCERISGSGTARLGAADSGVTTCQGLCTLNETLCFTANAEDSRPTSLPVLITPNPTLTPSLVQALSVIHGARVALHEGSEVEAELQLRRRQRRQDAVLILLRPDLDAAPKEGVSR